MKYTKAYSCEKAEKLDKKIEEAIRKVYGYTDEGNKVLDHFMYTLDDAESYFGMNGEYREDTMYSGDFEFRNEED